jgi:hypothetical protein
VRVGPGVADWVRQFGRQSALTLATINSAARQPRGEILVTTSAAIEIDESLDPFASANLDDPYPYYTRHH